MAFIQLVRSFASTLSKHLAMPCPIAEEAPGAKGTCNLYLTNSSAMIRTSHLLHAIIDFLNFEASAKVWRPFLIFTMPTFSPFSRLPAELRLKIWKFSLGCIIERVWKSLACYAFVCHFPTAREACSESRVLFERLTRVAISEEGITRWTHICYELDTVYARHHCNCICLYVLLSLTIAVDTFNFEPLQLSLRALAMDWGYDPYWCGRAPQGPKFIAQNFPYLQIFTLIFPERGQIDQEQVRRVERFGGRDHIESIVATQFHLVKQERPAWVVPYIRFSGRNDFLQ